MLVNGKHDTISVLLYKPSYARHKRDVNQLAWIAYVQSSFDRLRISDNWLSQTPKNKNNTRVKSISHDNFKQNLERCEFRMAKAILRLKTLVFIPS